MSNRVIGELAVYAEFHNGHIVHCRAVETPNNLYSKLKLK